MQALRRNMVPLLCGVLGGCSSAAYDAAYAPRVAAYRQDAEFAPLQPKAFPVAGGPWEVRLPTVFTAQLDGTETPPRSTPPFLREFPGFAVAYEAQVETADCRFPLLLTIGVAEGRKDEIAEAILRQVRADEEFGKATWQKGRAIVDVGGTARTWDVLELSAPQPFRFTKAGVEDEKRLPGTTEVWLAADPGQKTRLVLAWRVPDEAAARLPLAKIAGLTARTARIVQP